MCSVLLCSCLNLILVVGLFFCTEESFVTVVTVLVSFVFYSFVFSYGCCEFVLESKPSIELLKQVTKDNKMTLIWTILARKEHYHWILSSVVSIRWHVT